MRIQLMQQVVLTAVPAHEISEFIVIAGGLRLLRSQ